MENQFNKHSGFLHTIIAELDFRLNRHGDKMEADYEIVK